MPESVSTRGSKEDIILLNLLEKIDQLPDMPEWQRNDWLKRFRFLKSKDGRHQIWRALGVRFPHCTMENIKAAYYAIPLTGELTKISEV